MNTVYVLHTVIYSLSAEPLFFCSYKFLNNIECASEYDLISTAKRVRTALNQRILNTRLINIGLTAYVQKDFRNQPLIMSFIRIKPIKKETY